MSIPSLTSQVFLPLRLTVFFGHWVEGITSVAKLYDPATKFNGFGDNLYSLLQIEEDGRQLND
ncbi:hypothetical protein PL11201_690008 [Planktothrix sp. PCC 11201]|nr:hypothetical protein PL11201_690008 [Planktothrix sp. PCC 11201]